MGHADFVLAAEMRHQARESLRDKIEADAGQEKLFLMEELEGETLQLAFEDASHMDNLAELIRAGKIPWRPGVTRPIGLHNTLNWT